MNKEIIYIQGMHCRSCEIILENNLSKLEEVKKVDVSQYKGSAEIYYNHKKPNYNEIEKIIKNSGYSIGRGIMPLISKDSMDYFELVLVGSILFIFYIIAKIFGFSGWNLNFGNSPSYFMVFVIGLTAGISTCMALIGGLVAGVSARHAALHPEANVWQKFRPHLYFNIGRLLSYGFLGGLMGLLGSTFNFTGRPLGFLIIITGLAMVFIGIKLTKIFPRFSGSFFTLPKGLSRLLGINKENQEYSHKGSFITGTLTFFLPCGFTQAMQIYALSTGSFVKGGIIMFLFALGTMPGLLGIGGLTSIIKGAVARYFFKFIGLVVIIFGAWSISNGFNLTGVNFNLRNDTKKAYSEIAQIVNGKQIVKMKQLDFGYQPNRFTIKKDIPVKWEINSTNSYTCASIIVVSDLNIFQRLNLGPNIIEFIPTKVGPMKWTCSMGMYSGYFNVVE